MANSRWDISNWKAGETTLLQAVGLNWSIKYPKVTATLANQEQAAATAAGSGITGNISTGGATGAKGLYNALRSAGASENQAVGMIANAMAESSLNPEADPVDSNGYRSYGLWQFNAATYPSAKALVTGNPAKDMIAQIQFLFQVGGLRAASGSTPAAVASNFAANFEKCEGCEQGGAQNTTRTANAATVLSELGLLWLTLPPVSRRSLTVRWRKAIPPSRNTVCSPARAIATR
jgi:hypothetical protein